MQSVSTPTLSSHSRTHLAVHSLPLSPWMWFRHTPADETLTQPLRKVPTGELPRHVDRETLPRELVDNRQHPERPTIRRPVHHEVVAPHMVPVRLPQPNARPVSKAAPSPLRLFRRNF